MALFDILFNQTSHPLALASASNLKYYFENRERQFYFGIDKGERKVHNIGIDGYLVVHSDPFRLKIAYSYDIDQRVSFFERGVGSGSTKSTHSSKNSLASGKCNGTLSQDFVHDLKFHVENEIVYFQDKPLSEYLK